MPRPIFRQAALDRLASPEQLDQLMPVAARRDWLTLAALLILAAAALAWGLVDRVPVQVAGRGILAHGGQILAVTAPAAGAIETLLVRAGDEIGAGAEVAELRPAVAEAQTVVSRVSGRVLEVMTAPGRLVAAGDPVVTIEDTTQPLAAVLYLPAAAAGQVRAGQPAQITIAAHGDAAALSFQGVVQAVGAFPASSAAMSAVLNNDRLVALFSAEGAPIAVRLVFPDEAGRALSADAALITGFVITGERRPLDFLWPGP